MRIDEAIKIKEDQLYKRYLHHPNEIEEADKLSIEALKRVREERIGYERYAPDLLPGETEERPP